MEFINVEKVYKNIEENKYLLSDISMFVCKGEFLSIMGPSGSGKSTLLGLLAGIDTVSKGNIQIKGTDITKLSESQLCRFRNENMGIILQSPNLIETLTAIENIQVPLIFAKKRNIKELSKKLLRIVGLSEKANIYPKQLSGGEAQRIAVARALACEPDIILADEPTGALDSQNGEMIIKLLKNTVKKRGVTVIMVTHDVKLAEETDRIIKIKDGRICCDE
ncbi:MAG: ABC transporter ATP-binding protein [Lachnospiraceae bacterium]|jgi:putative ABC transport system ATP-binding protein|nr:ABC transporter ATP-binding protein [Lachnospiraceae bacterium]